MPSTYSTRLRLELQAAGENQNSWGDKANTVFRRLEEAITGVLPIAMGTSVSAPYDLTYANGTTDQARYAYLIVTGQLASAVPMRVSAVEKGYFIYNQTSGQSLSFGVVGRAPVSLASGWNHVVTDGSATYMVDAPVSVSLPPGTVYLSEASASSTYAHKTNANTFAGAQTFSSITTFTGQATFNGSVVNQMPLPTPPSFELYATQPAFASATAATILFTAQDLVGSKFQGAGVRMLVESAQALSAQSRLEVLTKASNGALSPVAHFSRGLVMLSATGGDKGVGTINAQNMYINGQPVLTSSALLSAGVSITNTGSGIPVIASITNNVIVSKTISTRYFTFLDGSLNNTNNTPLLGVELVRAFSQWTQDASNIYLDVYQYYVSPPPDTGGGGT